VASLSLHVRFGSEAEVAPLDWDVCFASPKQTLPNTYKYPPLARHGREIGKRGAAVLRTAMPGRNRVRAYFAGSRGDHSTTGEPFS
jgi:hypothetical protein